MMKTLVPGPHATTETTVPEDWAKTPRNASCPCGSGKKYKKCHGLVIGDVVLPKIGSPDKGVDIASLALLAEPGCKKCNGRGYIGFTGVAGSRYAVLCPKRGCAKHKLAIIQYQERLAEIKAKQEATEAAKKAQEELDTSTETEPQESYMDSPDSMEEANNGNVKS